ncbi:hypothetical protein HETIRDRAFT_429577 [Heterobasidion irregulare TC 32-1]|uniref:Uncharacterized protein n=1 Tax=Heterobasidion irregulare (strain TC 32-1) TaxID=747525 RepID=W4JUS6_HETIT|nr:uncharacterized protein HETIRDRAFT_429577 [Heterobasidion irregulare TC 32-1]ETW77293.1 hypothetical protein HETIRDRAFT_429577 [Heterobasidion irregulare TC 32-1]
MGKKRKTVPAALHSELTEYSNLLRVLRTQGTLDITVHLAPSAASSDHNLSFDDNAHHGAFGDDSGEDKFYNLDATSSEHRNVNENLTEQGISLPATATLSASRKGKARVAFASAPGGEKSRVRDTWTRWPLLAGDVHVPEWGFADEVYLLARQALDRIPTLNLTSSTSASTVHKREDAADAEDDEENIEEDDSDLDSDADSQIPPAAKGALSSLCEAHLGQILAALASHVPLAESSMQNRIRPLGWVDVLDIVSVSGLVDDV